MKLYISFAIQINKQDEIEETSIHLKSNQENYDDDGYDAVDNKNSNNYKMLTLWKDDEIMC